ncbi:MAG TPA: MMPL family transporter [Thermoanaerobaculia bacterium]|nr:MMPL family transporter [Thermoanaerobaculia bacterium]
MSPLLERLPILLTRASVRHPRRAIAAFAAVILLAAPGLLRLELRTDGHALVPPKDPAVLADAEIRQHFGLLDPIVVLIETSDPAGIYNPATLRRVKELSDALAALPGVGADHVMSLATERRDRVYPGTLTFRPFLDPLPDTPELLATLRDDVEATGIAKGTLVSYDSRAAAIHVGTPDGRTTDRISLYNRIREAAKPFETGGDRVVIAGAPVAEALLGTHILQDLAILLPACLAVISLVIWLGCRRLWGVLLALSNVGAAQVFTFGMMGWMGFPVHLTTAMLPVILTTIGVADEVHVFWHYQRVLSTSSPGEPHREKVARTLERLAGPIVFATVTTAVGFLSFLSSPIEPVRSFGLFAGVGVLFCLAWSFVVTPAALTLLGPERLRHARPAEGPSSPSLAVRWVRPLLARPGLTLAGLAAATLLLGAGVPRLFVQDSWIDGFAPGSSFREAIGEVNGNLHGTHILLAHLTFPAASPEPLATPAVLEAIGGFERHLRSRPGVGGVLGPHSHLTAVTYLWLGRQEDARAVPKEPSRVELAWERFDMGRGEHRRREVVDDNLRRGVVTVFLKDANYRDTEVLMQGARDYAAQHLAPLGAKLDFGGDVAVSQAMIPAIVRTQVSSVLLALVSSFAAVWLATRRLGTSLLTILPVSVAVLWVFGGMGWAGIPLGVATSMFCSISLGIGVDYAIHFLDRLRPMGSGQGTTLLEAEEDVGPAIVVDTVAIALGFGLLALSQVPANARFGGLVALALVASCVLTLAGLGALLAWRKSRPA